MIKDYLIRSTAILFIAMIFSSCLNDNDKVSEAEYSADAQIYEFSATASYDSTKALEKTTFAINQISTPGYIFNRDSLFYGFVPHAAKLKIKTRAASGIKIYLSNPDSSYVWNNEDSVALNRLRQIEVFAADANTTKKYQFKLNIHQIEPDSIVWKKIAENYISGALSAQKTIMLGNQFYTYYVSGNQLNVTSSAISDGTKWTTHTLSGIPENYVLSSLCKIHEVLYMTDATGNLYASEDGLQWQQKTISNKIKAIYGVLPSNATDSILTVIDDNGILKFAKTEKFATLRVMNAVPEGLPISEFSAVSIKKEKIYNVRFITLAGGKDIAGAYVNRTWLLKENDGKIVAAASDKGKNTPMQGTSLLKYDDKLYLLSAKDNRNVFFVSENYGVSWKEANKKQRFPLLFDYRTHQSAIVDDKNNIWIFGGISFDPKNSGQVVDVWKGRLNKLIVND